MICTNAFRLLTVTKDGGPESRVWAYWLISIKRLFSIVLLKFENGTRDAYHNHAFNCVSWVLCGELTETVSDGPLHLRRLRKKRYTPSLVPVVTRRSTLHQVESKGRTWVISVRGPWVDRWKEEIPCPKPWPECSAEGCSNCGGRGSTTVEYTHGRVVVSQETTGAN